MSGFKSNISPQLQSTRQQAIFILSADENWTLPVGSKRKVHKLFSNPSATEERSIFPFWDFYCLELALHHLFRLCLPWHQTTMNLLLPEHRSFHSTICLGCPLGRCLYEAQALTQSVSWTPRVSALGNAGSEVQGSSNSIPAETTQDACSSSGHTFVHPMKAARQDLIFKFSSWINNSYFLVYEQAYMRSIHTDIDTVV